MDTFFFIILISVYPAIGIANLILMNKIYNSINILLSVHYQYSTSPSMSYSWSPSAEPEED